MHQSQNYFNKKNYKIFDEQSKQIYILGVSSYYQNEIGVYINPRRYNVQDKNSFQINDHK